MKLKEAIGEIGFIAERMWDESKKHRHKIDIDGNEDYCWQCARKIRAKSLLKCIKVIQKEQKQDDEMD